MILTDDDELADTCRSLRNLCFQENNRFVHKRLGWNLRMTNMQAALGVAQLERLDEFVLRKREMGKRYTELLSDCNGLQLPLPSTDYAENIYWVYGVVVDEYHGMDATVVMKQLAKKGIGTRPFFYPMHLQPILRGMKLFTSLHLPVSERLYRQGFYIPSGMALTDNQIQRVAEAVKSVIERH
jgi:perosamine synthetase